MRYGMIAALGPMTAAERSKGRYMRAPDHPAGDPPADPPAADPPAADPPADPPAADPPAAETPPVVSYDDAFAEALKDDAGTRAPDAPAAPPAPPTAPPAPEAPPAPPAAPPAPPTPAAPPAPPAPPSADDVVSALMKHMQTPPAAPAAGGDQRQQQQQPEQAPLYSPEETTLISEYETNWPDVSRAEQLKRRAEYHDLIKFVFDAVAKVTNPLQEQMGRIGNTLHTSELKELVPDYAPALEADVTAWIDSQPAYLQGPYKQVMQTGTSDEVADLIGRYRAATGAAPVAPAPPTAPTPAAPPAPPKPPAAPKTELSQAAKQAAGSLAPVGGDRTQPVSGDDPGDFNAAFAKYAASEAS